MIRLVKEGSYKLVETKNLTKILILDENKIYTVIYAPEIGKLLVRSTEKHESSSTLAVGKYRLYDVKDESSLTDLMHLELLVGNGVWQGYLLPTGLPTETDIKNRIIPTYEIITKSFIVKTHE